MRWWDTGAGFTGLAGLGMAADVDEAATSVSELFYSQGMKLVELALDYVMY